MIFADIFILVSGMMQHTILIVLAGLACVKYFQCTGTLCLPVSPWARKRSFALLVAILGTWIYTGIDFAWGVLGFAETGLLLVGMSVLTVCILALLYYVAQISWATFWWIYYLILTFAVALLILSFLWVMDVGLSSTVYQITSAMLQTVAVGLLYVVVVLFLTMSSYGQSS